jgi:hypothetical protein
MGSGQSPNGGNSLPLWMTGGTPDPYTTPLPGGNLSLKQLVDTYTGQPSDPAPGITAKQWAFQLRTPGTLPFVMSQLDRQLGDDDFYQANRDQIKYRVQAAMDPSRWDPSTPFSVLDAKNIVNGMQGRPAFRPHDVTDSSGRLVPPAPPSQLRLPAAAPHQAKRVPVQGDPTLYDPLGIAPDPTLSLVPSSYRPLYGDPNQAPAPPEDNSYLGLLKRALYSGPEALAHGFEWITRRDADVISSLLRNGPIEDQVWNHDTPALEQSAVEAPQNARHAASDYISELFGNGKVDPSIYRKDTASRISSEAADFAPYLIPGVGEALGAAQGGLQARELIRGVDQQGLGTTAAGVWDSLNPGKDGLYLDERLVRALNLAQMGKQALEHAAPIAGAVRDVFGRGPENGAAGEGPIVPKGSGPSSGGSDASALARENAQKIQDIAEIHGALSTLNRYEAGAASPDEAMQAAGVLASHKLSRHAEDIRRSADDPSGLRRIHDVTTPASDIANQTPVYAQAQGPGFSDLRQMLNDEFTKNSGLYPDDPAHPGLPNDQARRLVQHLLNEIPSQLLDGTHVEAHKYLGDRVGAQYDPNYDTLQLSRDVGISDAAFPGSKDFAVARNVALKIGHELGHRLEQFLGTDHFNQLNQQYFGERHYIREHGGMRPEDAYRYQSLSEWFAHKFADHVDQQILRPAQVKDFLSKSIPKDRQLGPGKPGEVGNSLDPTRNYQYSPVNAAIARLGMVTSDIARAIKIRQLNGREGSYADHFISDFLKKGNPEDLRYMGIETPAQFSSHEPGQYIDEYKRYVRKEAKKKDWEQRPLVPPLPRVPFDQRQNKIKPQG